MDPARLNAITERYSNLSIAVLGDFCLDRYLEIDPSKQETSLETGLPVHIADDPLSAVAEGTGRVLNELQFLEKISATNRI